MKFKWLWQHYWLVLKHKWFVAKAARQTGVSLYRVVIHDWSKLLPSEALAYARHFLGDDSDPEGFSRAWLHHQNTNPHHWEYWLLRSGKGVEPGTAKAMQMPEKFVREMIADWMAASKAYSGTWDMGAWLRQNFHQITLHPETRKLARGILYEIGYDDLRLPHRV